MKLAHVIVVIFVMLGVTGSNHVEAAESNEKKVTGAGKKSDLKLNTLKIQASKELPKALYIVPWQEVEIKKGARYKQQLVLHSLYGDLFDPITSDEVLEKQP